MLLELPSSVLAQMLQDETMLATAVEKALSALQPSKHTGWVGHSSPSISSELLCYARLGIVGYRITVYSFIRMIFDKVFVRNMDCVIAHQFSPYIVQLQSGGY